MSQLGAANFEAKAREALEHNLWVLWSHFGRGEGCVLHDQADALWFDTPIALLPYNSVLRFSVSVDAERRIEALFEHYRQRQVPFLWVLHPSAQPTDLGERLLNQGMEEVETCPGMAMPLGELPEPPSAPAGVEIREALASDNEQLLELVAWRWEVPAEVASRLAGVTRHFAVGAPGSSVRCWIAWQDGAPVSKVVLHLAAGAAGIYGVITKPEARGMGLARALTLHALHAARSNGYRMAILHSTEMALGLYERLGFRSIAPFKLFAPPSSFHV